MELVLETLDWLVGFDSASSRPNAGLLDRVAAFCEARGATVTRLPGSEPGKGGLAARFGPDAGGGIVLSGHTDTVPADESAWTRPPFALTREGDRLFGRGATDMKGFLACMLAAGDAASRERLARPLTLAFTHDEEIGCVGIQELMPTLRGLLGEPRLCVVGEPTQMRVATGHKGKTSLRARCRGQNGHSALAPQFVNALHLATDFVAELRALQAWFEANGARDPDFAVPCTTVHAGALRGGTALNVVPELAEIDFEVRFVKADPEDSVLARVEGAAERVAAAYRERWPDAAIEIDRANSYPGLDVDTDGPAAQLALDLSPCGKFAKVDFGTEAGVYAEAGISAVVCGPGSMAGQGHKPDEFVELDQLVACKRMLELAVETLR